MFWLTYFNPDIDWKKRSVKKKVKTVPIDESSINDGKKLSFEKRSSPTSSEKEDESSSWMQKIKKTSFFVCALYVNPIQEKSVIFEKYQRYKKLFADRFDTKLPEYGLWDCIIPLQKGYEFRYFPIYSMNQEKFNVLKEYMKDNLINGYIQSFQSPIGYSILFVFKKNIVI